MRVSLWSWFLLSGCFAEPPQVGTDSNAGDESTVGSATAATDGSATAASASATSASSTSASTTSAPTTSDATSDGTGSETETTTVGETLPPMGERWCEGIAPGWLVCEDFDGGGPVFDPPPPPRMGSVEVALDMSNPASPPNAMAFNLAKPEVSMDPLDGLFSWSTSINAVNSLEAQFEVFFHAECPAWVPEFRLRIAEVTVVDGVGAHHQLALRLGAKGVDVWSYEPSGAEAVVPGQAGDWTTGSWIPVRIEVTPGAPSSFSIEIDDVTLSTGDPLWDLFDEITEIGFNFGPWENGNYTIEACSYYSIDNVVVRAL